MVSNTFIAWSSVRGFDWVGPVQTLPWASRTVWFGRGMSGRRYVVDNAGFRTLSSSVNPKFPNSSVFIESIITALIVKPQRRRIGRWSLTGNNWRDGGLLVLAVGIFAGTGEGEVNGCIRSGFSKSFIVFGSCWYSPLVFVWMKVQKWEIWALL